jgi:hypothetical protein
MSKQKYSRRDSGLLVPGDHIEVAKPKAERPWWQSRRCPSFLWYFSQQRMRECCCDESSSSDSSSSSSSSSSSGPVHNVELRALISWGSFSESLHRFTNISNCRNDILGNIPWWSNAGAGCLITGASLSVIEVTGYKDNNAVPIACFGDPPEFVTIRLAGFGDVGSYPKCASCTPLNSDYELSWNPSFRTWHYAGDPWCGQWNLLLDFMIL